MANKRTIGELIECEVRRQQIPITEFAKLICCQRNNVYDIFKRSKMDIVQLKQISKVLHHNFFQDLAEDIGLINEGGETEEEILKGKAVSQFFEIVPDVLKQLGKASAIVFGKIDEAGYEDCVTPDFGLSDYFITFTVGGTLKERIGCNQLLPIETRKNADGIEIEICTNVIYLSRCINIKLDYKSPDEWYNTLKFAFEIYSQYEK